MQYWIIKDGESQGPYSLEELKNAGLTETTKIWHKGLPQWTCIKDTDIAAELFPAAAEPLAEPVTEPFQTEPVCNAEPAEEDITVEIIDDPETESPETSAPEASDPEPPVFEPPVYQEPQVPPIPDLGNAYRDGYNQGFADGCAKTSGEDRSKCPPTNLVWAILSTVLCCLPIGIVAIIYASKVTNNFYNGDYDAALRNSDKAAYWSLASAIIWMVTYPIVSALSLLAL